MLRITERFTFQWDFVIYYKKLKVHCHFDPIKTNVISYHLFLEICNEYLGMPLQFLFLPSSPCTSSSNKNPFPYCLIPIWGVLTAFYPAMTAFTDQYSLPNIFFDIGQL